MRRVVRDRNRAGAERLCTPRRGELRKCPQWEPERRTLSAERRHVGGTTMGDQRLQAFVDQRIIAEWVGPPGSRPAQRSSPVPSAPQLSLAFPGGSPEETSSWHIFGDVVREVDSEFEAFLDRCLGLRKDMRDGDLEHAEELIGECRAHRDDVVKALTASGAMFAFAEQWLSIAREVRTAMNCVDDPLVTGL
jgi:hypothetical protein